MFWCVSYVPIGDSPLPVKFFNYLLDFFSLLINLSKVTSKAGSYRSCFTFIRYLYVGPNIGRANSLFVMYAL